MDEKTLNYRKKYLEHLETIKEKEFEEKFKLWMSEEIKKENEKLFNELCKKYPWHTIIIRITIAILLFFSIVFCFLIILWLIYIIDWFVRSEYDQFEPLSIPILFVSIIVFPFIPCYISARIFYIFIKKCYPEYADFFY